MPCSYLNYVQQALYLVVHSLVGPLQGIETWFDFYLFHTVSKGASCTSKMAALMCIIDKVFSLIYEQSSRFPLAENFLNTL